jgi:hypothetical protein
MTTAPQTPQAQTIEVVTRPNWKDTSRITLYCDAALCKTNVEHDPSEHYNSTTLGGTAVIVTVNDKLYSIIATPIMGSVKNNNVLEARAIVRAMRYAHDRLAGKVTIASDAKSIIDCWGNDKPTSDTQLGFIAYKRYLDAVDTELLWVPRELKFQRLADLVANLAGTLRHETQYTGSAELEPLINFYYQSWNCYRGKDA